MSEALERHLEREIEGEVRFDRVSRALYSTDASVYQIEPLGVVVPKSRADVVATVNAARQYGDIDYRARRWHIAGRTGGWRRHSTRHVEILQPNSRTERRLNAGSGLNRGSFSTN